MLWVHSKVVSGGSLSHGLAELYPPCGGTGRQGKRFRGTPVGAWPLGEARSECLGNRVCVSDEKSFCGTFRVSCIGGGAEGWGIFDRVRDPPSTQ